MPPADPVEGDGAPDAPNEEEPTQPQPATIATPKLPARPLGGTRRALRDYYESGSKSDGRKAAGRFARSAGGGGAARYARAAQNGGAAFAGLSRAANGFDPVPGALDLRGLSGRPIDEAIAGIVNAFCPSGILDEEATRIAMGQALFEVFGDADFFTPEAIDDAALLVAVRCYVTELVFASLVAEAGKAADSVPPAQAVSRENGLRDLVREVADHVGTPLLQNTGAMLSPQAVENVVISVTSSVIAEMEGWE
jgi:hypothetical protein